MTSATKNKIKKLTRCTSLLLLLWRAGALLPRENRADWPVPLAPSVLGGDAMKGAVRSPGCMQDKIIGVICHSQEV